ncbi:hypothetical protein B6K86_01490 [Lachnospiraceae bacterium]|nr:hypothetical protein B6K86_01490 [Lachnospiraceae bacterium]
MKKTIYGILPVLLLSLLLPTGCSRSKETSCGTDAGAASAPCAEHAVGFVPPDDGVYQASFQTDSPMFHVNEAYHDMGELTVSGGQMMLHISLPSKNIVNLFPGTAEEAEKKGATWLEPTVDTVRYPDGLTEEVYGFDIPVPKLGEQFPLALLGKKGTWYAHMVSVQIAGEDSGREQSTESDPKADSPAPADSGKEARTGETGTKGDLTEAPEVAGQKPESRLALAYASGFDLYRYQAGYDLIDVHDSARYLLVPEGKEVPEGVPDSWVILPKPPKKIYLAATAAMSLFDRAGAMNRIRLTGTDVDGWYIEAPKRALETGKMLFAGRYSAPDFERLTAEGCDLAIESTMILHKPEIKEMLEDLGIPVFIDRSSYEPHPLGRTEWVRLYGVLTGTEAAAEAFFQEERKKMEALSGIEATGKTVAYFYLNADGGAVVRKGTDYITKMLEIAGGTSVFSDLRDETSKNATMTISREEFYQRAKDADFLVYNATIGAPFRSAKELIARDALFREFRAVREGRLWQVKKDMYQSTDCIAEMTEDFHHMLTDEGEENMRFLERLK